MSGSPIVELLTALDRLDVSAAIALCAPDCRFAMADGCHAQGRDAVQQLMTSFLATLRSVTHEVTSEWHQGDDWIAEMVASYELQDWTRIEGRLRVFIVRVGPDGIREVRVYGANERPLGDRSTEYVPVRLGGRLILPL